ncbi:MAG TPA: hypothetical protein VG965_02765 [Patescibacteria group bacterium]|nr:hypothetical protein [Patescibacteria group bacterium]
MIKQKITYVLATIAFLGSAIFFQAHASEIQAAGNGAFSNTSVNTNSTNTTNATQNSTNNIQNNIVAVADTGHNSASFNTGSTVNVTSGDANTNVSVANLTNGNTATVMSSAADSNTPSGAISAGNGAFSQSSINTNTSNNTSVSQNSNAHISNTISAQSNTANNAANFNTGSNVSVQTGNANNTVGILNSTGSNTANVTGNDGNSESLPIVAGNGAFSANNVDSSSRNSTNLSQSDITQIANHVAIDNNTGNNGASFNTGGNVNILTGNANSQVGITNLTGGNMASITDFTGNDWLPTYLSGNGALSDNSVSTRNTIRTNLTQNSLTNVANYIESMNNTGGNNASFNTGTNVYTTSGSANSFVSLFNTPSANSAYLSMMGGFGNAINSTSIFGNGAFSNNNVSNSQNNVTQVDQNAAASILNNILSKNNTGDNGSAFGTGGNDFMSYLDPSTSFSESGNAGTTLSMTNLAPANYLSY